MGIDWKYWLPVIGTMSLAACAIYIVLFGL
jgi:hypothetical protein